MRTKWLVAGLVVAASASPAALAQARPENMTGIPTDTQSRMANDDDDNVPWDALGLVGLLGLLGLRRGHSEDSYHPAPVE